MLDSKVSRRRMMQLGVGAATAGVVPVSSPLAYASAVGAVNSDGLDLPGDPQLQNSIKAAYTFLRQMMDAYAQGSTVRLCQSYCDQIAGGTFFSTAFTYDNALLALAFLARGRSDDIARAIIIGNALLYAQQTDPAGDGRLRQAYMAGTPDSHGVFVTPGLSFFQGSAVGDVHGQGSRSLNFMLAPACRHTLRARCVLRPSSRPQHATIRMSRRADISSATAKPTNRRSTILTCTLCSRCWRYSLGITHGWTVPPTQERLWKLCSMRPLDTSGPALQIRRTSSSITVRKMFRRGRIWHFRIPILRSRWIGSKPISRPRTRPSRSTMVGALTAVCGCVYPA